MLSSAAPLLLLSPTFPSIRVFFNGLVLHSKWPKYRNFSFSISPSNEYSGLISFRIGLVTLLSKGQESSPAPQSESINSSTLNLLYGPTLTSVHDYWKNHRFDILILIEKMMFLLFNVLFRFVKAFLPMSKCLLTSWLQSLAIWV